MSRKAVRVRCLLSKSANLQVIHKCGYFAQAHLTATVLQPERASSADLAALNLLLTHLPPSSLRLRVYAYIAYLLSNECSSWPRLQEVASCLWWKRMVRFTSEWGEPAGLLARGALHSRCRIVRPRVRLKELEGHRRGRCSPAATPTLADQVSKLYELVAGYHTTNLLEIARS